MAAVTAAVIAGAATMASTGAGIAAQQGAFGGGEGGGDGGGYKRTPLDPHQRAMRDYYARMAIVNQESNYPSFGEFLSSGGDPEKSDFELVSPGMKPSEAAALGLTGGRGERIPYYDEEANPGNLKPEQRLYLAKERRRHARETGGKMPTYTWAESQINAQQRFNRRTDRLAEAQAIPEEDRTIRQQRSVNRLPEKLERMKGRHPNLPLGSS